MLEVLNKIIKANIGIILLFEYVILWEKAQLLCEFTKISALDQNDLAETKVGSMSEFNMKRKPYMESMRKQEFGHEIADTYCKSCWSA